ncbi:MAG TPA: hypothetical protein V6D17_13325 [Candidatus Obscuribacterales bacterium]
MAKYLETLKSVFAEGVFWRRMDNAKTIASAALRTSGYIVKP